MVLAGNGLRDSKKEVRKAHLPKGKRCFGERKVEEECSGSEGF